MLKLIITDPHCNLPDSYRDADGFFSIPIPETVAASLNYDTASLSELGAIIASFSNTFELVADRQTQNMLTRLHFRKNRQGLSARLQGGLIMAGYYFPGLIVVQRSIQNLASGNIRYGIQFLGTHQTWKDAARSLSICQIDCGTIFNNAANVEASWDNDIYVPGGQPFYLPLVSKGPWLRSAYRVVEDFDFICVYLAHLLLEGFCRLGYTIESEFVNTAEFRKKIGYLLSDAYFNREGINKFGKFRSSLTALQTSLPTGYFSPGGIIEQPVFASLQTVVLFDDDFTLPANSDVNNLYLPAIGQYSGYTGNIAFSASATFEVIPQDPGNVIIYQDLIDNEPIQAQLFIRVQTASGEVYDIAQSALTTVTHSTTVTLTTQSPEVNLFSTDIVFIVLVVSRLATNISSWTVEISDGYFSSNPNNNIIQRNQTLRISDLLDCEITLYSLLEDLTKLYNLQYYTNEPEKKVYIEPEYRWQDWAGLPHRGSRRDISEAYDISRLLNTGKDIEKDFSAESGKRYLQFLFADGGDYHSTRYNEENARELHSSDKTEVGDSGNDTEEIRLSLFRPTQTIYDEAGFQDPYALQVPAIWNAEPAMGSAYPEERTYSIGSRIFHLHGMSIQPNKYGNLPVWYYEDTTPRNAYPKAYQVNKDNPANSSVVYGSPLTAKTQLSTFYRNLSAIKQAITMSAELTLQPRNIACFDTRNPVLIDSNQYPPEVAGYYYIKKLSVLQIARQVQEGQIDLIPLTFIQSCEVLCNLTATYTTVSPTTSGGTDGSITLTAIGAYTGLVSFVITDSEENIVFSLTGIDPLTDLPITVPNLGAGVYLLSLLDEAGCTLQEQVILTNPCVVVIEAEGSNPTTEGGTDGSITITALTGVAYPVAVIVKQGAANVFSQSNVSLIDLPLSATNLSAGTYTVIVIDSAGCSTSLQIQLTDTGACAPPDDFAVFSNTDTSITLQWTVTAGNTYNVRYKLASDLVWITVTNVSPNLLIPGLDPCLMYEFQIETICEGESLGFSDPSLFATTDCPCEITFTVTPLEGAGISVTNIEGLSEGASPIIVVTDCEGNPIPTWWESVPECYRVCVIDSCTCCRGCQTSCFITLAEPEVSECDEETATVNIDIDVSDTNIPGDLWLYYSADGITWVSGGASTPGIGWILSGVPANGSTLYVQVQNPEDNTCAATIAIELPNCCGEPGLEIVTDACDNYELWITSDSFDLPFTTTLIDVTVLGVTYTPPAPLPFTDLQAVEDWLNSLGLPVFFIVVSVSLSSANVYVFGQCCVNYAPGDFKWTYDDGVTTDEITLDFLANMTCDLIHINYPDFECCVCIQANPTGSAGPCVVADVLEYSLNGGGIWLPYSGECLDNGENPIHFRRTITHTEGCPCEEVTVTEIYTPPPPPEYNLKIGGMNWGSAAAAEAFLQVENPLATVSAWQDNGDGTESIVVNGITALAPFTFRFFEITYFEDLTGFLTDIGLEVFGDCTALTTFIANAATNIGYSCFAGCTSLALFSGTAVTNLGGSAGIDFVFDFCAALTSVTVPTALATINAGSPDGDLTVAAGFGATINYV